MRLHYSICKFFCTVPYWDLKLFLELDKREYTALQSWRAVPGYRRLALHKASAQCSFNIGPASQSVDHHLFYIAGCSSCVSLLPPCSSVRCDLSVVLTFTCLQATIFTWFHHMRYQPVCWNPALWISPLIQSQTSFNMTGVAVSAYPPFSIPVVR